MCTVLTSIDPDARWPVLVAFVRDEERSRRTLAPGAWWPEHPAAIGGLDERAGGTWLALDAGDKPRVALLTDQFGPDLHEPDPARSPTRGTLPLAALGADFHPVRVAHLERYQPFHLVRLAPLAEAPALEWWQWDGASLEHARLGAGTHVIASRTLALPGEGARRARLRAAIDAAPRPAPGGGSSPADAWGAWIDLLDGRDARPDDLDGIVVHSVGARAGFGTVGATLVGIAANGAVRYDVNHTTTLDPDAWNRIDVNALAMRGIVPSR